MPAGGEAAHHGGLSARHDLGVLRRQRGPGDDHQPGGVASAARERRPSVAGRHGEDARRRRRGAAVGRGRHDLPVDARQQEVLVPQRAREDGRSVPRRLLHRRRHGLARRGRLPLHRRPAHRHGDLGRRQHLSRRDRGRAARASRRRRRRGLRRSRRALGRVAPRGRGAAPRHLAEAESLQAWCRERLADYKTPRSVDLVAELPRDPNGKVLKRQLREPFWAGQARSV